MIRISDVATLVKSKLQARRARTLLTVLVSSLLFGVLIAGIIIVESGLRSVNKFNEAGLGGRYLVEASWLDVSNDLLNNESIQKRAETIYDKTIKRKEAVADKLGINFDPSHVEEPIQSFISDGEAYKSLNASSPAAQQALSEYRKAHPSVDLTDLEKIAGRYSPLKFYTLQVLKPTNGTIKLMENGQEDFKQAAKIGNFLTEGRVQVVDDSIITPFLLETKSIHKDSSIPIVVTYSEAESLLNLTPLSSSASSEQQLGRLKLLSQKASDLVFAACYRNELSASQIDAALHNQAIDDNDNEVKNEGPIIYGLPDSSSCAAARITKDNRNIAQKDYDRRQQEFNKQFGIIGSPVQRKINYQIVGLVPDSQQGKRIDNVASFVRSLIGPSYLGYAMVSNSMYKNSAAEGQYGDVLELANSSIGSPGGHYLVEFSNAQDANRFMKEEGCNYTEASCPSESKPFNLVPYGSSSLITANLKIFFDKLFAIITAVAAVIAMIIMGGTISRVIADDRREMAVFRALGATTGDLASIYLVYTLFLSMIIAIAALIIGALIALLCDWSLWQQATVEAKLTYGNITSSHAIHFFSLNVPAVFLILGVIVATGLVSLLLPLQQNISRSPVDDLKDE